MLNIMKKIAPYSARETAASKNAFDPQVAPGASADRQFATTLAKGLEILRCFTPDEPFLANRDLTAMTGLPKATVSRFTYTLTRLGYLRPMKRSGRYQLGSAVLTLGYPLLASMTVRQMARGAMTELAEYAQGSVSMAIRDRLNMVYVETSRSRSVFSTRMADIGMAHPIVATAIGRGYLCACTPEERSAFINEVCVKTPEQWQKHGEAVNRCLDDYRRLRFCVSYGDLRPEIHAVAAPLRRAPNADIIVFNCVVQSFQLGPEQLEKDIGPRLAALVQSMDHISRY